MTEKTFAVISNILSTMPSQQPWDDRVQMVYALAIQRWDDDLAQRAVTKALMTKKFRPTVSELRDIAMEIKRVKVPSGQAVTQIRHLVTYHPVNERAGACERMVAQGKISPIIPEVVKSVGGWSRVGNMTDYQLNEAIERVVPDVTETIDAEKVLSTPVAMIGDAQVKMIGD